MPNPIQSIAQNIEKVGQDVSFTAGFPEITPDEEVKAFQDSVQVTFNCNLRFLLQMNAMEAMLMDLRLDRKVPDLGESIVLQEGSFDDAVSDEILRQCGFYPRENQNYLAKYQLMYNPTDGVLYFMQKRNDPEVKFKPIRVQGAGFQLGGKWVDDNVRTLESRGVKVNQEMGKVLFSLDNGSKTFFELLRLLKLDLSNVDAIKIVSEELMKRSETE